jgi:hypothetical protein
MRRRGTIINLEVASDNAHTPPPLTGSCKCDADAYVTNRESYLPRAGEGKGARLYC